MFGIIFWICVLFILYVYLGYPILVALFAKFKRQLVIPPSYQPTVTLVFAAHNEENVINQKLENSLALDYPPGRLQILVADDGSTDRTASMVGAFRDRGVELVSSSIRRGKLAALIDALVQARGEVILFSDADNFYPPDALSEAMKYFSNPTIGAVSGGRNVVGETSLGKAESLYWRYEEFIKRQESRLGSCVGVAGDLLAIRKELFIPPPQGIINDDFYMALGILKQGYRVIYAPQARSYHPIAGSEKEEVERRTRMAAGRYQVIFGAWRMLPFRKPVELWQIISHKYLRPLIPFAMILAFIANLFSLVVTVKQGAPAWLVLASPYNWIMMTLHLIFYLISGIGLRFKLGGMLGKVLYLPTFLVNSNYAALQGFFRYITSKQTVVWKQVAR